MGGARAVDRIQFILFADEDFVYFYVPLRTLKVSQRHQFRRGGACMKVKLQVNGRCVEGGKLFGPLIWSAPNGQSW